MLALLGTPLVGLDAPVAAAPRVGVSAAVSWTPHEVHAGSASHFAIDATLHHLRGASGYSISFGDGARYASPTPMFCRNVSQRALRRQWRIAHTYAQAGTYQVLVTVRSACGGASHRVARYLVVHP